MTRPVADVRPRACAFFGTRADPESGCFGCRWAALDMELRSGRALGSKTRPRPRCQAMTFTSTTPDPNFAGQGPTVRLSESNGRAARARGVSLYPGIAGRSNCLGGAKR
jgi:hypothetical protein